MQISEKIYQDNGGAIPDVLFDAAPEGPNSLWRRACKMAGCNQHPAISPRKPIETMIGLTTEPGDLVYDPFGGSLLTAKVAEDLGRRWITTERSLDYIKSGCLRFETAGKGQ
jgi:site-specific DNA-methyltransferase (cytosine-N4-specific)